MKEIKDLVEIIPDDVKKEIYKDGIKTTVIETGETLSLIPRTIKNAFSPLKMWCMNREFRVKELELELQKKLEIKKEENIVDCDPSIFIPSAQAISYNWDKIDIREMYLNLMVSDMDITKKENVHPSFSEIIKQMDSIDVQVFTKLYRQHIIPVYVLKHKKIEGTTPILDYLLDDGFYINISEYRLIKSLNNLERLKLIDIDVDSYYVDKKVYNLIENSTIFKNYKAEFLDTLVIKKGMIKKTEFGKGFFNVCCGQ
ncbi:MAG: DUF4393 domain-containing protein [Bacilli bacterium]|nr:DUF4393 domain-containing protein [Bacilli bacterium]